MTDHLATVGQALMLAQPLGIPIEMVLSSDEGYLKLMIK
jgi:hypothetical protein